MSNDSHSLPQACRERHIEVAVSDLPVSCPPAGDRVWDAHPRVYLPLIDQKEVVCPYCATQYTLKEESNSL